MDRILEFKTCQMGILKDAFQMISAVSLECNIEFKSINNSSILTTEVHELSDQKSQQKYDGSIIIVVLNDRKTILTKLKLHGHNFETFRCDEPKIIFGVNMIYLNKCLKQINDNDTVIWYMNNDNRDSLYLKTLKTDKESGKDIEIISTKLPKINIPMPQQTVFERKISIDNNAFTNICIYISGLKSDYIEIETSNDGITFCGRYGQGRTSYDDINSENNEYSNITANGKYDINDIMKFVGYCRLCNIIEIYMKNDFPLLLVYNIGSLGKMYIFVTEITDI